MMGSRPGRHAQMLETALFTIGLLTALAIVVAMTRRGLPRGSETAQLGAVSERWLAEYRASHQE